ncbi:MAG TPA: aminopeptidase, partial [bacterium]|nr:aminopeptidase [bacterium]
MSLSPMAAGAMTVVRTCAAVAPGEHVLILTDAAVPREVADALAFATEASGGVPVILTMPRPERPGVEPPPLVAEAMKRAHVVLAPTSLSVYHTEASRNAAAAGARMLAISECRAETLVRGGITAEFAGRAPVAERLARQLSGQQLELRTPAGTHLSMTLGGRAGVANTGLATQPGTRSGLPTIEAYIAPLEGTADGVAVVDASVAVLGLVSAPITVRFKEGRAVDFGGGAQARALEDLVERVGH